MWSPEPDLEQRRGGVHADVDARAGRQRRDGVPQPRRSRRQLVVHRWRERRQRGEAGRGPDRVAVERPAVGQRAGPAGVEAIHDLGRPAECGERIAAADDLAERRQVRADAGEGLGSAGSGPERDDLVEDQDGTGPVADRAEHRQELGRGGADPTGALDRLDHDRGELRLAAGEGPLDTIGIVPGQRHDEVADGGRHAGRAGDHRVVRAVVGALEDPDERPAGHRPGGPDREHRRLGAGVREPHPFDRVDPPDELLGEADLELARRAEGGSAPDLRLDRGDHRRMGMAEDQRGVVAEEVAVVVPVDVPDVDPRAAGEIGRIGRGEDRRSGRATGQDPRGALEQRRGARRPGPVGRVQVGGDGSIGDGHGGHCDRSAQAPGTQRGIQARLIRSR